ncbi:hypothetical protein [Caulobacter sp. DWR1-3-2b1]|uniref:hypothetical protein n=1 Tax=Caulobacter sp. DWR1-3-2b1 TaxID=2804670 RepID=UPI003CE66FDE
MLLSALLLATVVQAAPTPPSTPRAFIVPTGRLMRIAPAQVSKDAAVAVLARREACRRSNLHLVDTAGPVELNLLGDLPRANHTLAVLRTQGGCSVSSTIRYNIGR